MFLFYFVLFLIYLSIVVELIHSTELDLQKLLCIYIHICLIVMHRLNSIVYIGSVLTVKFCQFHFLTS